jgi:hypothetical protein
MALCNQVYLIFAIEVTFSELWKRGTSITTEGAPKTLLKIMHVYYQFAYVEN